MAPAELIVDGPARIQPTADVDARATIGEGVQVWHLAQVRENARIGRSSVLGRGAYIGPGVEVGENCKVQNYALVYEPAVLEDGVFVGPGAVLTNDLAPRAVTVDGALKTDDDWDMVGVTLRTGASVGARATLVAPLEVGRWAMIAAGAVVTHDVPDHALMVGVPARQAGWVGRAGVRLVPDAAGGFDCPSTGEHYGVSAEGLELR